MSIPDTIGYITVGMSVYMRRSEFEFGSTLEFHSGGLWLDAFERPFIPAAEILECVDAGKFAAVVSPELHRKPHMEAWQSWRNLYLDLEPEKRQRIMLCTDFPKEAEEFFGLSQ